jgi:hypothetical protein
MTMVLLYANGAYKASDLWNKYEKSVNISDPVLPEASWNYKASIDVHER